MITALALAMGAIAAVMVGHFFAEADPFDFSRGSDE